MVPVTNDTVHINRLSNTTFESDECLNVVAINISLACLMVFTLIGNVLVLLAFYVQLPLRKVIYFPIISLALADLLCALTAMPLYIVKKNNMALAGINERLVCDFYRFFYFFTEYASISSLMAISIERFLVIHNPLKYRGFISLRVMITGLIVCWLEAFLVSSMPFYWRNEHDEECTNSPTTEWSFLVITVNVFFPFLVMLLCHCYIYRKTLKKFSSDNAENTSEYCAGHIIRAEDWKMERKATISFTVVIGVFVLCWGPSTMYYFIQNICPGCFSDSFKSWKSTVNATMKILTFSNSFINPVIYFWLNMDFRKAFIRVLKREWDSKSVVFSPRSRSGTANSGLGFATTGNVLTRV